jgi:AbrB family looped-hinge helix DNA binding protein
VRRKFGLVTRKGQITLPAEMRRALGLSKGDRVSFTFEEGGIRVSPVRGWVKETAGILRSYATSADGRPLTAEELREAAEIAIAEEADRRDRQ